MNEGMNDSRLVGFGCWAQQFPQVHYFSHPWPTMALKRAQKIGGEPRQTQWHDDIHLTSQTLKPSTTAAPISAPDAPYAWHHSRFAELAPTTALQPCLTMTPWM